MPVRIFSGDRFRLRFKRCRPAGIIDRQECKIIVRSQHLFQCRIQILAHETEGTVSMRLKNEQHTSGAYFMCRFNAGTNFLHIVGIIVINRSSAAVSAGEIKPSPDAGKTFCRRTNLLHAVSEQRERRHNGGRVCRVMHAGHGKMETGSVNPGGNPVGRCPVIRYPEHLAAVQCFRYSGIRTEEGNFQVFHTIKAERFQNLVLQNGGFPGCPEK